MPRWRVWGVRGLGGPEVGETVWAESAEDAKRVAAERGVRALSVSLEDEHVPTEGNVTLAYARPGPPQHVALEFAAAALKATGVLVALVGASVIAADAPASRWTSRGIIVALVVVFVVGLVLFAFGCALDALGEIARNTWRRRDDAPRTPV